MKGSSDELALAIAEGEVINVSEDCNTTLTKVTSLVKNLSSAESQLEHGYATLGVLLNTVSEKKYWKEANFKTFGAYLQSLTDTYKLGRAQLYGYMASTKTLLESNMTEEDLVNMGPTKAKVLSRAVKGNVPLTDEVKEAAVNPETTVADVQRLLYGEQNKGQEKGDWLNLGDMVGSPNLSGFYVNDDEQLVIRSAFDAARLTDPIVSRKLPPWQQGKLILLRLCMEYLNSHPTEPECDPPFMQS